MFWVDVYMLIFWDCIIKLVIVIIIDCSRGVWIYFLVGKGEFNYIDWFCDMVKNMLGL